MIKFDHPNKLICTNDGCIDAAIIIRGQKKRTRTHGRALGGRCYEFGAIKFTLLCGLRGPKCHS